MDSLNIDDTNNDLFVDGQGNLAVATGGAALALNAACAIRTFSGEVFYDSTQGLPYFQSILGKNPPLEYVRSQLAKAALNADSDIVASRVFFSSLTADALERTFTYVNNQGKHYVESARRVARLPSQ